MSLHCVRDGSEESQHNYSVVYRVLVGKPEGKRPLERPRRRWKDVIKMDLREIGWGGGGVEWVYLDQDRDLWRALVNAVMNLRVLAPRSQLLNQRKEGISGIPVCKIRNRQLFEG
jgi:hypothetical protein